MSAGTRSSRSHKRERELFLQEEATLDISDDFREAGTVFRLPKKLKSGRPAGRPKKNVPKPAAQNDVPACSERGALEEHSDDGTGQPILPSIEHENKAPREDDLIDIEKSLCSESEKLCPSCKHIVPSDMYGSHFKECIQRFKLSKSCTSQSPKKEDNGGSREGDSEEQGRSNEKHQPALPCPVCKKPIKSRSQRVSHMKSCALDHGLTPQQLLLASRLLEKQTEEWSELGLPVVHSVRPSATTERTKMRPSTKRCPTDVKDPDIALALALSRSIAEQEVNARALREEKLLALGLDQIVDEDRKTQPVLLPPSAAAACSGRIRRKPKGRDGYWNSVLATRSVEEREKLISEKVAAVLASEEHPRAGWCTTRAARPTGRLAQVLDMHCQLWETASTGPSEPLEGFYVQELEPYIKPKQTAIGGLFRHLSQIPGRLNTTTVYTMDEEESESVSEDEETSEFDKFCTQAALAELLGSQGSMDATVKASLGDIVAEDTKSQGFQLPSPNLDDQRGKHYINTDDGSPSEFEVHVLEDDSDSWSTKNSDKDYVNVKRDEADDPADHMLVKCHEDGGVESASHNNNKESRAMHLLGSLGHNTILRNKSKADTDSLVLQCTESKSEKCFECSSDKRHDHCINDVNLNKLNSSTLEKKCDVKTTSTNLDCEIIEVINIDSEKEARKTDLTVGGFTSQDAHNSSQRSEHAACLLDAEGEEVILREKNSQSFAFSENLMTQLSQNYVQPDDSHMGNVCVDSAAEEMSFATSRIIKQAGKQKEHESLLLSPACNKSVPWLTTQCHSTPQEVITNADRQVGTETYMEQASVPHSEVDCVTVLSEDINNSISKDTGGMEVNEFSGKNIVPQSGMKITSPCSKTGHVLEHEEVGSTLIRIKSLQKDSNNCSQCGAMPDKLVFDWGYLLENGTESDVTVKTLGSTLLTAHSLVFLARCPQLYEESKISKSCINWSYVPQEAAYFFLAYLYTGNCKIKSTDDHCWMYVFDLANRYKCKELVSYMESLYKGKTTPVKTVPDVHSPKKLDFQNDKLKKLEKSPLSQRQGKESLYSDRASWGTLSSDGGDQEGTKYSQLDRDTQSPDLFDEPLCIKSNSTELIAAPQLSPIVRLVRLGAADFETFSATAPEKSSYVKSTSESKLNKKHLQTTLDSSGLCSSVLSNTLKSNNNASQHKANIQNDNPSSRKSECKLTNSSLSPNSDQCESNQSIDEDIINLTDNESKCSSDTDVADPEGVSSRLSKTPDVTYIENWIESHPNSPLKAENSEQTTVGDTEHCSEEPETDSIEEHYISSVWDDFDDGFSKTVLVDLSPIPTKLTSFPVVNGEEVDSSELPSLSHLPNTQSPNPSIGSTLTLHQKQDTPEIEKSFCKSSSTNSPKKMVPMKSKRKHILTSERGETDSEETALGCPGDDTLLQVAAEVEEWNDDVLQPKVQEKHISVTGCGLNLTMTTPYQKNIPRRLKVTPQPNYNNMTSPELKSELQKFGVCALGRRKAVAVLHHLYEQTHPLVTDSEAEASFSHTPKSKLDHGKEFHGSVPTVCKATLQSGKVKKCKRTMAVAAAAAATEQKTSEKKSALKRKDAMNELSSELKEKEREEEEESEESQLNSSMTSLTSSEGSVGDCLDDPVLAVTGEEDTLSPIDLGGQVQKFITGDPVLHRKVLLYEPIFVDDLHSTLKANGIKCGMKALMVALDNLCITVRTQVNQKNRTRGRPSRRRKQSSQSLSSQNVPKRT